MIKLLLLSRYCRIGASTRLRTLQYLPYLKEHGFQIDVHPFYPESYLRNLYRKGSNNWGDMLKAHLKRAALMTKIGNYDLIWIEKEIFPWLPAFMESFIHRIKIPYVVDYDDAIFHKYDMHKKRIVRQLLGHKIDTVMNRAALVVAGNAYLAKRAQIEAGAKNVRLLPTVIDLKRYQLRSQKEHFPYTIGWIGSPTTAVYLRPVIPVLIELQRRYNLRIVIVGAGKRQFEHEPFECLQWSEASESKIIQTFDVGIMPLPDTPWARGKCGYKLIQYMACGVPVVASDIGANRDVVNHSQHGYLATTLRDWYEAIKALYLSAELRKSMSLNCRDHVEKRYHLGINAPILEKYLRQVAS